MTTLGARRATQAEDVNETRDQTDAMKGERPRNEVASGGPGCGDGGCDIFLVCGDTELAVTGWKYMYMPVDFRDVL